MHLLKAIIIDDEEFCQKNLAHILTEHCPEIDIVGYADSAQSALDEIKLKSPDLIFLDINIPGKSGLEVLEEIKERNFSVIVVTGEKEYGIQALKQDVIDYVLKPLDEDIILESVQKTGKILVVDSGWQMGGVCAEIGCLVAEKGFSFLKGPVRRMGLPDIPTPAGFNLEQFYYPNAQRIATVIREMVGKV